MALQLLQGTQGLLWPPRREGEVGERKRQGERKVRLSARQALLARGPSLTLQERVWLLLALGSGSDFKLQVFGFGWNVL